MAVQVLSDISQDPSPTKWVEGNFGKKNNNNKISPLFVEEDIFKQGHSMIFQVVKI